MMKSQNKMVIHTYIPLIELEQKLNWGPKNEFNAEKIIAITRWAFEKLFISKNNSVWVFVTDAFGAICQNIL